MSLTLNAVTAVIGGILGFMFGKLDGLFITLIALVIFDYLTGVIKAIIKHKLSSAVSYKGILKKFLIFLLVATANVIDFYVIGDNGVLRNSVIMLFIANEGISIIENAAQLGVPIPKKLRNVLQVLKKKSDETDSTDEKK